LDVLGIPRKLVKYVKLTSQKEKNGKKIFFFT
jgi:hypothetical protein